MVKKGFIAFGWLKKPMFLMIRAGWSLPKTKNPAGVNLPNKKQKSACAQSILQR